jgi:hypothetical protein
MHANTAPIQADALQVGDLLLCGIKFREVLKITPLFPANCPAEMIAVRVSDRGEGNVDLYLPTDLTLTIRSRSVYLRPRSLHEALNPERVRPDGPETARGGLIGQGGC